MESDDAVGELAPEVLADLVEGGDEVSILDVRNRDEIETWAIEGPGVERTAVPHVRFVSAQVTGNAADLVDPDESYVVVCPRGEASGEVAATLRAAGVDAVNLAGGMLAWARVYRTQELSVDARGLDAVQFRRPATGCLAYALVAEGHATGQEGNDSGGEALVVDPLRAFTDSYLGAVDVRGATIESVLDTHVHADHLSGLRSLADVAGARGILSRGAADRGVEYEVDTVTAGDEIVLGDAAIEVLATPGHTTGAISLRCGDLLLTGDSLFVDGVPRPDLEAGQAGAAELAGTLHETLNDRFADVPDDLVVAPGHYVPGTTPAVDGSYTARLGILRDRLRAFDESAEAFVDRILDSMGQRPANYERIIAANLGTADVNEDEAFELELGPNNCAVSE